MEPLDARVAAASMQGDQEIALSIGAGHPLDRYHDVVTQFTQNPRPAVGRHSISKCGARRFGSDYDDLHDSSAQVRNPAQMSDRSGV